MMQTLEEYAEGGMEILCEEVFNGQWNGRTLNNEYDEYEIDISKYIYDNIKVSI